MVQCQSAKTCTLCQSRHHTLLHDAYHPSTSAEASSLSAVLQKLDRKAILLATARVTIADHRGRPHDVRVLIDQGSEISLISEALAQRLHLPRTHSSLAIRGIGGASPGASRGKVSLSLSSETTGTTLSVVAHTLPRLSSYSGPTGRNKSWPHIRGLPLADPRHFAQDPIDLLLGADAYSAIIQDGIRRGRKDEPIAQRTSLGWILSGGCRTTLRYHHNVVNRKLDERIQRPGEQRKEPSAHAAFAQRDNELRSPCTAGGHSLFSNPLSFRSVHSVHPSPVEFQGQSAQRSGQPSAAMDEISLSSLRRILLAKRHRAQGKAAPALSRRIAHRRRPSAHRVQDDPPLLSAASAPASHWASSRATHPTGPRLGAHNTTQPSPPDTRDRRNL